MKHLKFLTIAVASVMAVSAFALASCDKNNNDDDGGGGGGGDGGSNGAAILTDTSIQSKIISAYTFENGGSAVDAYTGEALSQYDVTLSDDSTVTGKDGKGISSGDVSMTLPKFQDAVTVDSGFSFTFMSYSEESLSDWNVLLTSDYFIMTYGNLSSPSAYPAIASEIGRGAYSAEMFAAAKEAGLTTADLVKYNTYSGYNAGVVEGESDTDASKSLYAEMVGTWQVMTVVVTDNSVRFYRNGALSYVYGSTIVKDYAEFLLEDVHDLDGGDSSAIKMFTGAGGNIDNLIFGTALSAQQVIALYNDLTDSSLTADDAILQDADESAKTDIAAQALINAVAERSSAIGAIFDEELAKVTPLTTVGLEDASTAWWSVFQPVKFADGSKTMKITYLQKTSEEANWKGTSTILYTGDAEEQGIVRTDAYGWAGTAAGEDWAYTSDNDFNWDYMKNVINGSLVVETVTINDDGTITLRKDITPLDAGASYEGTASGKLSDGSAYEATSTLEVAESYFVEYTISGVPTDGLYISFCLEGAYIAITSVEGGVLA